MNGKANVIAASLFLFGILVFTSVYFVEMEKVNQRERYYYSNGSGLFTRTGRVSGKMQAWAYGRGWIDIRPEDSLLTLSGRVDPSTAAPMKEPKERD